MKKLRERTILLFLIPIWGGIAIWMNLNKEMIALPTQPKLVAPDPQLVYFTFGYNDMIVDSLWLRLVQDLGICQQNRAKPGEPRTGLNRTPDCEKGWAYQMLDVMTDLTPKFYELYELGGVSLSVLSDDVKGATGIYEKGVKQFPTKWRLLFRAATHLLIEEGNAQRAASLYLMAVENGAPNWVYSLVGRIYTQTGQALVAKAVLTDFINKNPDNRFLDRAKERLAEVEKVLAEEKQKSHQQTSPPEQN
ncbi:MAG: hypothetical protein H6626_00580 [Pseudobdellovibrionaceae bacterium]|nr:hypothetical protein [Bdellovibrionales bacterium]USN47619.1 MAG: hypothetical protein H6626_00580 [Pseudobdellovibrionaceae bacterium]